MFVYVKTLSGDVLTISCPLGTTHGDLPFLVHDAMYQDLDDPSVDKLHHLHVIPEGSGLVEDGQVFYLMVEDPQIRVSIQVCGMAITRLPSDENEDDEQVMDCYSLCASHVKDGEEVPLYQHDFYTPVAHVWIENERVKRYSNVYYHDEDVTVLYAPSENEYPGVGPYGAGQYRVVDILPGATAHHRPEAFSSRTPIPSYELALHAEIERVWREHVRSTGEGELYPIQHLYRAP